MDHPKLNGNEVHLVEQTMKEIHNLLNTMNTKIMSKLDTIESRQARLEKVDSIEHRVSVNQIDLTDIKEALERIEEGDYFKAPRAPSNEPILMAADNDHHNISERLDYLLQRVAKLEEEVTILKKHRS